MKTIGSQKRESLSESGMTLHKRIDRNQVHLKDADGNMELWIRNDHFAGYTIEINKVGYEFACSVT